MKWILCAVGFAALSCSTAEAVTSVLCVNAKGNGPLKFRAAPKPCAKTEIQIGSFDGTTLQFSGINVQVVSGSGKTDGTLNGKGNLIVGYNEAGYCVNNVPSVCNTDADCGGVLGACQVTGTKTGSHNLIVGAPHAYSSHGGLVAGFANTVSGPSASVSGGALNVASGPNASVSGGANNMASGYGASVSGGFEDKAIGGYSSISGGLLLSQPVVDGWAAGSATPGNTINGDFESP